VVHIGSKLAAVTERTVDDAAAVFVSAVLEYILAEILELAGNEAKNERRAYFGKADVKRALLRDDELHSVFGAALTNLFPELSAGA